jgi:hypothetical protein
MLSNALEPNSIQESNREAFRDRNADILRKLVAFVTLSQGLTIGFSASTSPREIDLLIDFLTHDQDCLDIDFIILDFPDPKLHFLLEAIVPNLESLPNHSKPRVVLIRGLEHSIGVLGEYPPVLVDLNFSRDAYRRRVPYPILFILPDYAITQIARFAPDFWAWKSVEFQLKAIQHPEVIPLTEIVPEIPLERKGLPVSPEHIYNVSQAGAVGKYPERKGLPVSQEHLDLINRLLSEYIEQSITRADLLLERSEAYVSHTRYLEAKVDALAALELYKSLDRSMDEAHALDVLSEISFYLGTYQEGEDYAKISLEIRKHKLGENHPYVASSLNKLAILYKVLQ